MTFIVPVSQAIADAIVQSIRDHGGKAPMLDPGMALDMSGMAIAVLPPVVEPAPDDDVKEARQLMRLEGREP